MTVVKKVKLISNHQDVREIKEQKTSSSNNLKKSGQLYRESLISTCSHHTGKIIFSYEV